MKVAYLVTGSGDSFYCGNCHRDRLYVSSIRKAGNIDITAVPLYLPPLGEEFGEEFDNPVFFGAVSTFLRDRVKLFENAPAFLDKLFDAPPLLRFAAKKAGATRTEGFEETTLNMIMGEDRSRLKEINRLATHLSAEGTPDIIHISNALIMGVAIQLKEAIGSRIVCSLQNEDDWIDEMAEPYRSRAWDLIGKEAAKVDMFVSPSKYFRELIVRKTGILKDKIKVIPSALEAYNHVRTDRKDNAPSIGYYSRLSRANGMDKIIDAYINIREKKLIPDLQLHLCGGYTSDNKLFIKEQLRRLHGTGFDDKVKIYTSFHGRQKDEFFSSIDLMSVPVRKADAYGLYILIANAAGVPVVQPATGAFPEIIRSSGGGIVYEPDDVDSLTEEIVKLLSDKNELEKLGKQGKKSMNTKLTLKNMAVDIISMYKEVIKDQ